MNERGPGVNIPHVADARAEEVFVRIRYVSAVGLVIVGGALLGGALLFATSRPSNGMSAAMQQPPAPPAPCPASPSWISSPNPPMEIGNGTPISQQTNCQFYQFSWQWFLALVTPAKGPQTGYRVFETLPMFIPGKSDQCGGAGARLLTDLASVGDSMFVRTNKPAAPPYRFLFPQDIKQAGDKDVLYDQSGNVIFYNVRFNQTECQATAAGFPPGTMEIKTAWRRIQPQDRSRYYTINALVQGVSPMPIPLGLVAFHLVRNTKDHPEFVWASFEHQDNVPDCTKPQATPSAGWSFLSNACAQCLAQNGIGGCPQCGFNTATKNTGLTGTPDQICRVFPDGTGPQDTPNNVVNRFNVDTLNSQLVGPNGFLTKLPDSNPMAIWKNYVNVGALWTNGGLASTPANQRGSLQLANATMETFLQSNTNCFSCHNYDPKQPLAVSHIYSSLKGTALSKTP